MMTPEEANKHLHDDWYIENGRLCVDGDKKDAFLEAVGMGIKALRLVSREQVEKVWRGEWFALDECSNEGVYCSKCKKKVYRIEYANEKMKSSFCPHCGVPMTDEAVQMVMERMKELK